MRRIATFLCAGLVFSAGAVRAGDAEQTPQQDDSNSHAYRSPRAERKYDNRQQAIEQKKVNNDTARLNAAAAQANEQAKRDELKSKLADSEAKRKDDEQARKDAAQAKREAAQEKKDAANLTEATLPEAEASEQKELNDMAALPEAAADAEAIKLLRAKGLAITLEPEAVALWQVCAREGDIAKVPPASFNAAMLINKGLLTLVLPLDPDKAAPVPDTIQARVKAATAPEMLDQDLLAARIKEIHDQKKLFVAGPAATLVAAWGDEKCATVVKDAEYVILPVEKWNLDDKSVLKTDFVATVRKYCAAIRKTNPKVKIFLEVGAKMDLAAAGGGSAEDWVRLLEPLLLKDAACFDGIAMVTVKTKPTDDPKVSLGAVKQMFAWLRPVPAASAGGADKTGTVGKNNAGPAAGAGSATSPEISAGAAQNGMGTRDSVEGTVGK